MPYVKGRIHRVKKKKSGQEDLNKNHMGQRTLSKITKIRLFPLRNVATAVDRHAEPCGDKSMFFQPRIPQLKMLLDTTSGDTDQGGRMLRRQAYASWGC